MNHVPLTKTAEIERNFNHFIQLLPSLMAEHEGEYALLRDTEIIAFYPSALDAQIAGNRRFPDHVFSIQLVKTTAEDLGYWSHALRPRQP
jgi:hypothetical protein